MHTTWRAILFLTFLSLLAIGTSFTALRVVAQERPAEPQSEPTPPDSAAVPADKPVAADPNAPAEGEGVVSDSTLEIPPDLRMNADDTISFPVDI
jgi:hypothetical protein